MKAEELNIGDTFTMDIRSGSFQVLHKGEKHISYQEVSIRVIDNKTEVVKISKDIWAKD